MNPDIDQAIGRLAEQGIDVSVVERDGVVYANVHATVYDDPGTWAKVFTTFLAIKTCVQIR